MNPHGITASTSAGTAKAAGGVAQICDRLAECFEREVPLNPAPTKGRRPPTRQELQARTEAGLARFLAAARAEREAHRLGIVGRARVALGTQQRLLAAGYALPLVKQVLFTMLAAAFTGRGD